jgi:hypothetical protein
MWALTLMPTNPTNPIRPVDVMQTDQISPVAGGTGYPRQVEGLEISQAANGYVIFDAGRDRVHYLNHTAVVVLELCNGTLSPEDIAAYLQDVYSLPEPPLAEVGAYVTRLTEEGLVG